MDNAPRPENEKGHEDNETERLRQLTDAVDGILADIHSEIGFGTLNKVSATKIIAHLFRRFPKGEIEENFRFASGNLQPNIGYALAREQVLKDIGGNQTGREIFDILFEPLYSARYDLGGERGGLINAFVDKYGLESFREEAYQIVRSFKRIEEKMSAVTKNDIIKELDEEPTAKEELDIIGNYILSTLIHYPNKITRKVMELDENYPGLSQYIRSREKNPLTKEVQEAFVALVGNDWTEVEKEIDELGLPAYWKIRFQKGESAGFLTFVEFRGKAGDSDYRPLQAVIVWSQSEHLDPFSVQEIMKYENGEWQKVSNRLDS